MRIAVYELMRDKDGKIVPGIHPIPVELSWDQLCALLSDFRVTECAPCQPKDCPGKLGRSWSPVEMEGTRKNVNARLITAAVIDLDHIAPADFPALCARLDGYECIIHSTHSHRPWDWCLRLVLPFTAPVPANAWPAVWRTIVEVLELPRDEQCKDTSRVYYLPSHVRGGERVFLRGEGQPLNTDTLLHFARERALTHQSTGPQPLAEIPLTDLDDIPDIQSVDLVALIDRLKELRYKKSRSPDPLDRQRYEVLNRIIKGEPLAIPGWLPQPAEVRAGVPRGRDGAINQAATLIAFALPLGTPVEAAIEVLRPSIGAMDRTEPDGSLKDISHWIDEARDCFNRASARRRARDEEAAALDQALRERLNGMLPRPPALPSTVPIDPAAAPLPPLQSAPAIAPTLPAPQPRPGSLQAFAPAFALPPVSTGPAPAPDPFANWQEYILKKPDGTRRPVGENAYVILAYSEQTRNTFRFNAVEKTIEVTGGPFKNTHQSVLKTVVTDWLTRFWDLSLPEHDVKNRILRLATDNSYDPLAEYLYGLQWDGVNRIDDFLFRYCNASPRDLGGRNIQTHIADIGRKWLISAVARALNPGCKVDTVLIIEGEQGDYKSQMLEVLGGRWYCGDTLQIGSPDSKAIMAKNWIVEMAELDAFWKVENATRKNFFSQRVDQYRQPYAEVPLNYPRRAVIVGTYNPKDNESYFSDPSGNRRYWPFRCGQIRLNDVIRDRDQIWAQAVVYFKQFNELERQGVAREQNPYRWWFNKSEQVEADRQTQERMTPNIAAIRIAEWWASQHPHRRPAEFSTFYIADQVLRYPADRITHGIQTVIGSALKEIGFQKHRVTVNGLTQWMYRPSDALKAMPLAGRGHLQLITDDVARAIPGS